MIVVVLVNRKHCCKIIHLQFLWNLKLNWVVSIHISSECPLSALRPLPLYSSSCSTAADDKWSENMLHHLFSVERSLGTPGGSVLTYITPDPMMESMDIHFVVPFSLLGLNDRLSRPRYIVSDAIQDWRCFPSLELVNGAVLLFGVADVCVRVGTEMFWTGFFM